MYILLSLCYCDLQPVMRRNTGHLVTSGVTVCGGKRAELVFTLVISILANQHIQHWNQKCVSTCTKSVQKCSRAFVCQSEFFGFCLASPEL